MVLKLYQFARISKTVDNSIIYNISIESVSDITFYFTEIEQISSNSRVIDISIEENVINIMFDIFSIVEDDTFTSMSY